MLSILLNLSVQAMAQTLTAQYTVTRQYDMQIAGNKTKSVTIEFTGHFYKNKNRYIYYDTPNFLKIYPDGVIKVCISVKVTPLFRAKLATNLVTGSCTSKFLSL
ncbi:hypothetical protein CA265_05060 [Sphingobacteriaceae bacterium GW460-11-11-14-LB5]|nr:hypothetical protein CA265_05060 [Sphingobacteriaceae bacterium GW460-11-11-14-LB5]